MASRFLIIDITVGANDIVVGPWRYVRAPASMSITSLLTTLLTNCRRPFCPHAPRRRLASDASVGPIMQIEKCDVSVLAAWRRCETGEFAERNVIITTG